MSQASLQFEAMKEMVHEEWLVRGYLWSVFILAFVIFQAINWTCWMFAGKFVEHYRRLSATDQAEWCSRVVSCIHGSTVAIACMCLAYEDRALFWGENPVFLADERIDWIFFVSAAYFAQDLVFSLVFMIQPLHHTILHHTLAAAGMILSVAARRYMWFAFFLLMCSEATAPFNNISWFAKKAEWKNKFAIFGWTVTFWLFRVANNWLVVQRASEHWSDLISQHMLLRVIVLANLTFLMGVHALMAVVTVVWPGHPIALPMPTKWIKFRGYGSAKFP